MKPTDKMRLDWMQKIDPVTYRGKRLWNVSVNGINFTGKTLRQAIDKAMCGGWTAKEIKKAAFKKGKQ